MGYGFVKFATGTPFLFICQSLTLQPLPPVADALRAIAGLSGFKYENKVLKVALARPQGSGVKNTNLYIAGLEPHVTSEELQTLFQAYGKVTEAKVLVGTCYFESPPAPPCC